MLLFVKVKTHCLKTKEQYVTRTRYLIMDFPALFLVILAIYLYGIRPHFYIYTFKSKGSHSNKSYFAIFPSLHFLRQVQFIVIATTSTAAWARTKKDWGKVNLSEDWHFEELWCLIWRKTRKMLNILLFLRRPFISLFCNLLFLDESFFIPIFILLAFQGGNVINTSKSDRCCC